MRIYIAGPMTGKPGWNFPAFFQAEDDIWLLGHDPVNPARTDGDDPISAAAKADTGWKTWNEYISEAVIGLTTCDAIVLLPGWQESKGARLEFELAKRLGLKQFVLRDGKLIPRVSVVGLSGYAQVGKDSAAAALVAEGYERVSFADPIRAGLLALNPIISRNGLRLSVVVNGLGWDQAKKVPEVRSLLQRFGTDAGREVHGDNVWIDLAFDSAPDGAKLVIPDVRFPNEGHAVRAYGGKVIRIERPGYQAVNGHVSDSAMDNFVFDHLIVNDGDLSKLHEEVLSYVGIGVEAVA